MLKFTSHCSGCSPVCICPGRPSALRKSTALRRADARLRELFEKHFASDAKGVVKLLVLAQDNKRTHQDIINA